MTSGSRSRTETGTGGAETARKSRGPERAAVVAALVVLAFAGSAEAGWYSGSWIYRKQITLNGGNCTVPGTACIPAAQTNFPVLVSLTDAQLGGAPRPTATTSSSPPPTGPRSSTTRSSPTPPPRARSSPGSRCPPSTAARTRSLHVLRQRGGHEPAEPDRGLEQRLRRGVAPGRDGRQRRDHGDPLRLHVQRLQRDPERQRERDRPDWHRPGPRRDRLDPGGLAPREPGEPDAQRVGEPDHRRHEWKRGDLPRKPRRPPARRHPGGDASHQRVLLRRHRLEHHHVDPYLRRDRLALRRLYLRRRGQRAKALRRRCPEGPTSFTWSDQLGRRHGPADVHPLRPVRGRHYRGISISSGASTSCGSRPWPALSTGSRPSTTTRRTRAWERASSS